MRQNSHRLEILHRRTIQTGATQKIAVVTLGGDVDKSFSNTRITVSMPLFFVITITCDKTTIRGAVHFLTRHFIGAVARVNTSQILYV